MVRTFTLFAAMAALVACQSGPEASAPPTAMAQAVAARIAANPSPGAGVMLQSVEARGKLVQATVRVPENDPGSEFFDVLTGRQNEVIAVLDRVVCATPGYPETPAEDLIVQGYIDDVDGDRIATVFVGNC